MMTDTTLGLVIVAALTQLPATIAALGAWRQARVNSQKTDENTGLTRKTHAATDVLVQTTGEIREQTNGNLDKLRTELKLALAENVTLKALNLKLVEDAARRPQELL